MGQARDMQSRLSRARSYVGDLITLARDFIYRKGLNVAGAAVERLLLEHSWVPTTVGYHWNHYPIAILTSCLECICPKIGPIRPKSI
jgi:hypothetical protein